MTKRSLRSRALSVIQIFYIKVMRAGERMGGPPLYALLITPVVLVHLLWRAPDYAQFRKLRASLPVAFWRGGSPLQHFVRMFRNWIGSLAVVAIYDRLRSPAWLRQITIRGTPPHLLPEWKSRSVVVVFFHTGGFPILRTWLRAQGTPTALYFSAVPRLYPDAEFIRVAGDRSFGLENVPHGFSALESLRKVIRFLKTPGRVVLVALEQRDFSRPRKTYDLNGVPICLNSGSFRMATLSGALLLPASVRQTGICQFEIRFGPPVPSEFVEQGNLAAANLHLARELWKEVENDPSVLTWSTLEALSPDAIAPRKGWP